MNLGEGFFLFLSSKNIWFKSNAPLTSKRKKEKKRKNYARQRSNGNLVYLLLCLLLSRKSLSTTPRRFNHAWKIILLPFFFSSFLASIRTEEFNKQRNNFETIVIRLELSTRKKKKKKKKHLLYRDFAWKKFVISTERFGDRSNKRNFSRS